MTTDQLITATKQLIAIPSTSDNPAALKQAVDFVADLVRQACPDVTIERFEQNGKHSFLAYRGTERPQTFDILLNAHVDVVPGKPEQFTPLETDGKLYGRGALDMKGTAVVLADVFCQLVEAVPYSLGLQIVSDEEVGGYDGVKLQIKDGVRAQFVVMGEYANTRNTIYNAARGLCWAEILFKGKTAHGGHLWHGTNAVVKAGDFAGALLRRYPTPDKETWTTTASIAHLSTPNETFNKVPDSAMLKVDFRFTQEDPVFHSRESFETFVHSLDPDAEVSNLATFEPAVSVEELNPYVQGLSAAVRDVTGTKARFLGRPGASDGRHYALVQNDIVEFGLYGGGSHSDHEYVELSSFAEYQATMQAFLQRPVPAKLKQRSKAREPLAERLLRELVAIPTTHEDRKSMHRGLSYIEEFLATRGMYIERFERDGLRSIVATTRPGNRRPAVLLNAHLDVVPAPEEMFTLKRKNGNFLGRGVMDMKHAIASYLALADSLKHELAAYDFGIMITCDEEIGSRAGVKPLIEEEGYRPKVVIIPDGGNNWELETFAKGVFWIRLEATGKRGHASRPWEGDSAIKHLLAALHEIEALVPVNPKPTDTLLSVGTITGGTAANQIPASASAMLDIRTGSVADHERLPEQLKAICARHGVHANILVNDLPCVTDPKHPLIKSMVDIIREITGRTHGTSYDYAVTDGRFFAAAGVPTIVINPECGGIHRDDEWLSQAGFAQFCEAIETYVRRMAVAAPEPQPTKRQAIAQLSKRLNRSGKPATIWYAAYGSGLAKDNFMCQIAGGRPEGSMRTFAGCSDPTPPMRESFISLPHALYFAGTCKAWPGGGHINIQPTPTASAHTIARAYLITIDQFEEIVAQQNDRRAVQPLPLKEAMQHGHATIGDGTGHYDELVYCDTKDGLPIFTLTAVLPELPYMAPSPVYARLLCKGLSENAAINRKAVVEYMLAAPGIAGHYKKQELTQLFDEATSNPRPSHKLKKT